MACSRGVEVAVAGRVVRGGLRSVGANRGLISLFSAGRNLAPASQDFSHAIAAAGRLCYRRQLTPATRYEVAALAAAFSAMWCGKVILR